MIYNEDSIGNYRSQLFERLNAYKHVNTYGGICDGKRISYKEKFDILERSKFTIAVEGCTYPGITTEKIQQPFSRHSIPIFYGNPNITKDFSEKAFINCHKYNNFDEILKVINYLDNNDEAYLNMLLENPLNNSNHTINLYNELEKFLYNIFDQEYNDAFRRVDSVISRSYTRNLKIARKILKFI